MSLKLRLFCFLIFAATFSYSDPPKLLESYLVNDIPVNPSNSVDGIDQIYIINLDSAKDRWDRMRYLLGEEGLNATRFSAISGWSFDRRMLKDFHRFCLDRRQGRRAIFKGQIGVFLSHLSIIKNAIENNFNAIWVLEDDVEFIKPKEEILNCLEMLQNHDPDWDFLYTDIDSRQMRKDGTIEWYNFEKMFGAGFESALTTSKFYKPYKDKSLQMIENRLGAYSIIISRRGLKKIWEYFSQNRMKYAYDVDINFCKNKRAYQTTDDFVTTYGIFGSSTSFRKR